MVDLFLNYGTVNIVCAEAQRNLGDFWGHHLPVGFDVGEIIQHQPADGDVLDVEHSAGLRQVLQRSIVGMKRQRDKGLEPVGLILQCAQL